MQKADEKHPIGSLLLFTYFMQTMQFVDFYRQYANEDSKESQEEVAHNSSSKPDKIFFNLEHAEAFIDIAKDHGFASPNIANKTYGNALGKMKKELKKKDIA